MNALVKEKISSDWQPIFHQLLPIHNYIRCFFNYFLTDFVSEVFIIRVTVKENSFQLKPSKRFVAAMLNPEESFILDPRQYITSAIKRDKVSI